MSLTPEQRAALEKPLMRSAVRQRVGGGGKQLNYLEAWFVKKTANEIFDFDGWSYTSEAKFIGSEVVKTKAGREGVKVGYLAHVTLTVAGVTRGDVGFGNSIEYSGGSIDQHELAAKEAVSDALKRCWTSFGDRFGLVLYDKDRSAA